MATVDFTQETMQALRDMQPGAFKQRILKLYGGAFVDLGIGMFSACITRLGEEALEDSVSACRLGAAAMQAAQECKEMLDDNDCKEEST